MTALPVAAGAAAGVVVNGTGLSFNIAASSPVQVMSRSAIASHTRNKEEIKPFILKLKTMCQSC